MHKAPLTAALLALAAGAHAADELTKSGINNPFEGYVHGKNHCYAFTAPQGWTMDNTALAAEGVPMIFLPAGTTWKDAPMVMYTRSRANDAAADAQTIIKKQVDETIAMYRESQQTPTATKEADITGKSGVHGELWHYTGYASPDVEEMAAYFPSQKTLNYFVLQLGKNADRTAGKAALLELAASYYERDNCQPCAAEPQSGCQNPAK